MQDTRALASVIGEDELSDTDKIYMKFGYEFENRFLSQEYKENRSIEKTLELAWDILKILPESELNRISPKLLKQLYK